MTNATASNSTSAFDHIKDQLKAEEEK